MSSQTNSFLDRAARPDLRAHRASHHLRHGHERRSRRGRCALPRPFRGPQALAAVTLMFPLYMLIVALATLVSSGMSSILARHLGAWRVQEARATIPPRMVSPRDWG
jgi:hypothetical protein